MTPPRPIDLAADAPTVTTTIDSSASKTASTRKEAPDERYRVEREVARGGLGRILRAHDRRLDRPVAIKELLTIGGAAPRERFGREASITARLEHPSIVPVYDAGAGPTGEPYYVMKLLGEGRTLKQSVHDRTDLEGRLALLPHVIAIADAMAYAHSRDIIHRDLKPSNVIVGAFGETLVIDWGLAKDLSREPSVDPCDGDPYREQATAAELTRQGAIVGTPAYMAPEQARGEPADKTSDVYSLGALLYFVLSGEAPFGNEADPVQRVATEAPPPLRTRQPQVPRELAAIVAKAMARRRADRYSDAAALADDLKRFQSGQLVLAQEYSARMLVGRWIRRHRPLLAVASAALLVLIATVALSFRRIERSRAAAVAKRNELILLQAKASLEHDPTLALAWLKNYPLDGDDWRGVQMVAAEADGAGVARDVLDTGAVLRLVVARDADSLVVGRMYGHVQRWDLRQGRKTDDIPFEGTPVGVDISPDGGTVALAGKDGELVLWDRRTKQSRTIARLLPAALTVHYSDDGAFLATAGVDEVRLLDLRGGGWRTIRPHGDSVYKLLFSHDSRRVITADRSGTVNRWDIIDGTSQRAKIFAGALASVAISDDDALLAMCGADGELRIAALGALDRSHALAAGPAAYAAIRFLPRSHRLVALSVDGAVTLFDADGAVLRRLAGDGRATNALALSRDGRLVATGDDFGDIRVWDLETSMAQGLRHQKSGIVTLTFAGDDLLVSSSALDTHVWAVRPLQQWQLGSFGDELTWVDFSPDGKWVASDGDRSVKLCEVATRRCRQLMGHHGRVFSTGFSADSRHLLSYAWDGTARVWDVATGDARVFETGSLVREALFMPDGQHIVVGSNDGMIRVWPIDGGEPRLLRGHDGAIVALAVASSGDLLASAGDDRTVRLWDVGRGAGRVLGRTYVAQSGVEMSSDGRRVASRGSDGNIWYWDLAGGTNAVLRGHQQVISSLRFTTDGRTLLSAGWDGTARSWDLAGSRSHEWIGHAGRVRVVDVSPDGQTMATGSDDLTVRLWRLSDGAIRVLPALAHREVRPAFSRDGRWLATSSADGTMRLMAIDRAPMVPREQAALTAWLQQATHATVSAGPMTP